MVAGDGFNQNVAEVLEYRESGTDNNVVKTPILITIIEIKITKILTKISK